MIQISLEGQTILITGALGAIAEVVNRRLLEAGATLIMTDIHENNSAQERIAKWDYPERGWVYRQMDVTNEANVNQVITDLFITYPEINLLIGLAGGCNLHPFCSTATGTYNRIFNFNYFGQLYATRAILAEWDLRFTKGHIVYTSSLVAGLPWVDLSAYISAKAAVETLSKCLALEYAAKGIRFNCVAPGHVAAGSSYQVYEKDPVYRNMTNRVIPLGRLVSPASVADAFIYLCSPMAQDITGQVIKVDCGASIPKVG